MPSESSWNYPRNKGQEKYLSTGIIWGNRVGLDWLLQAPEAFTVVGGHRLVPREGDLHVIGVGSK